MKKVITYGTYDLLHNGHISLLQRAKELGDYLIVGVTSDSFDKSRGKLNVKQSLAERIEGIRTLGIADKIIVEEYDGQKISDIIEYGVDIFTVGSDWIGKFDYLNEFCNVTYLERTKGISSTEIRNNQYPNVKIGLIGLFNPVNRFIEEAAFICGLSIHEVFSRDVDKSKFYSLKYGYKIAKNIKEMNVDAVYISDTIENHYDLIKQSLEAGFHVICESPLFMSVNEMKELFFIANKKKLIIFEALKTAYYPAFNHLMLLIRTGIIGDVKDIEVSFSKNDDNFNIISANIYNGSLFDLISYVLCPIFKILGTEYIDCQLFTYEKEGFNIFTKGIIQYNNAISTFKTGKGIKTEGNLVITGTKGYIYVPAPWWKTEYFELRFEDLRETKKFFYKCEGEGLRYEILEFLKLINTHGKESHRHTLSEIIACTEILQYANSEEVNKI